MPITPFMGVLISWLMLAKNSPLDLLEASAFFEASNSFLLVSLRASSASTRSVTSLATE